MVLRNRITLQTSEFGISSMYIINHNYLSQHCTVPNILFLEDFSTELFRQLSMKCHIEVCY